MSGIESKVLSLAKQHDLIPFGEQLVVGVSGGADSVCLLHVLTRYREELGIGVHVAHLNHQLRGAESDGDAKYVADLAGSLGVPITVGKRDVASYRSMLNCSVEEAARELRYDFLAEVAGDAGAVRVAVGHTRDDAVETILMHILRGTGTSGLRGLEACSPAPVGRCGSHSSRFEASTHQREGAATTPELWVIRPLLDLGREEILRYCDEHQLEPRVDSSNVCLSFFRNRIRLELLPLLRKY
ncbi:MAG: tRNA lysidine(34) synthetase TilS, partial [Dehalococcoidia bacterium]|nr:tRNA lysidine(34) synthetase TilS [Dehalococcoidia bacterium]